MNYRDISIINLLQAYKHTNAFNGDVVYQAKQQGTLSKMQKTNN